MSILAWIWSVLMIVGALMLHAMELPAPPGLIAGMVAAGIATLPTLWSPTQGVLGEMGVPAKARVSFSLIALLWCGLSATPYGAQAWYALPSASSV